MRPWVEQLAVANRVWIAKPAGRFRHQIWVGVAECTFRRWLLSRQAHQERLSSAGRVSGLLFAGTDEETE